MFTKFKAPDSRISRELEQLMIELERYEPTTEDYATIMEQVVKVHKLKADEKPLRVSYDTLAMVAANLLGIFMIIKHENVNFITSKALSFVQKPR